MKRVKKPKKPIEGRPARSPYELVTRTNYVNLAIMVRTLHMVYDWDKEHLEEFCEAYVALVREFGDHRTHYKEFVKDTIELTGINVIKLLDDAVRNRYDRN